MVGRNGVFYDRKGQDWDATITKVYREPDQHPPGVLVAVQARAALGGGADRQAGGGGRRLFDHRPDQRGRHRDRVGRRPGRRPRPSRKIDIGTVAALGVAVGGITAAIGALLRGVLRPGLLDAGGRRGLMLLISGPSMVIAWLKLRRRNLGPLLDANGWAMNTRAKINIPFGRTLTGTAKLPPGSAETCATRTPRAERARSGP